MTQDDNSAMIPSAEQQAHEWMVLLTSAEAQDQDHRRFERWLAIDEDNARAWSETQHLWKASEQLSQLGQQHLPRKTTDNAFTGRRSQTAPTKASRSQVGSWATGLAMAASIVIAVMLWLPNNKSDSQGIHYRSELAQTMPVHLPDGSVITLGAQSEIELQLSPTQRHVILHRGEAFFDVAKDTRRPFIVDSLGTQVSVLGTRFNVNQLSRRSKVSVQSGLVAVTHIATQKQVELTPGERVVSHSEGLTAVSHQDASKSGAWREGLRLYFDAPLNDVVADFNRYSTRPLELASEELGSMSLTAVFPTDDIDLMVHSLSNVLPITVQEEGERILLSLRQ
ncbi:MAG: FecR family protein [Cellvibrionaceae bacterium]